VRRRFRHDRPAVRARLPGDVGCPEQPGGTVVSLASGALVGARVAFVAVRRGAWRPTKGLFVNGISDDLHRATLIHVLRKHALERPGALAYVFLRDGERSEDRLTFSQVEARARAVARGLLERGAAGERVLILLPPGLDYIVGFLGCLYAGAVAVPIYPPRKAEPAGRLEAVLSDCRPVLGLADAASVKDLKIERLTSARGHRGFEVLSIDDVSVPGNDLPCACRPGDLAFLQYTSGSTGRPKGVMVTHGNLVANQRMIQEAFGVGDECINVGWLPLYHDMGLIGNVLQPLWLGRPVVLMSPVHFLQRPARWLEAISRFRGTVSGGPNFAFELCVDTISAEDASKLDLRSWGVAFNGAEPIRASTLQRALRDGRVPGERIPALLRPRRGNPARHGKTAWRDRRC
jgi:acyl-CoA synthetase (AMP-forming)/AMP-acid ligase II